MPTWVEVWSLREIRYGSTAGLCQTLIALMPPHDVDIESRLVRCVDDAQAAVPALEHP